MSWWPKCFCWCKFCTQEAKPENQSHTEIDSEIFFLGQQVFVIEEIWLSSSLPALPLLHPCQKKPRQPTVFLLSPVYITDNGTNTLRSRNFKWQDCVFFAVFLRRNFIQTKGLVHNNTVGCSKSFQRWFSIIPTSWYSCLSVTSLFDLLLREYSKNDGMSLPWLCYKRLWLISYWTLSIAFLDCVV